MIEPLYQAFQNGSLPPAWLFVGPPNSEKSIAAQLLAQKILGASQRQMDSGYYPNLFVLKKAAGEAELGIDDVRQLINYLRASAPLPGWRVVVIEGVDTLNVHAANALLKTLEEPPAQTLILATAVTAARVLPTLRSRCVRLAFSAAAATIPDEDHQLYESIVNAATLAARGDFRSLTPLVEKLAQDEPSFVKALELLEQFIYSVIIRHCTSNAHTTPRLRAASQNPSVIASDVTRSRSNAHDPSLLDGELVILEKPTTSQDNRWHSLGSDIPIEHWLNAQRSLSQFLHEARTTHLDKKHLLMACFIIIEKPEGINA